MIQEVIYKGNSEGDNSTLTTLTHIEYCDEIERSENFLTISDNDLANKAKHHDVCCITFMSFIVIEIQ